MMKLKLNKSKTILIAFAAFLLVFATVFTTVAYLTDTDDVHNTLTVGKVKIELHDGENGDLWSKVTHTNQDADEPIKLIPGKPGFAVSLSHRRPG
jgi:predicted ribosomally synthesized peptide with SipW-like signal peptide